MITLKNLALIMLILATMSCSNQKTKHSAKDIQGIAVSKSDSLLLAPGLNYKILLSWGDTINPQGQTFGFNNDFNCLIPIDTHTAWLWTNFEYPDPKMITHFSDGEKTREQVLAEIQAMGGSIMHLTKDDHENWTWKREDSLNKRITESTPFMLAGGPLAGSDTAMGMVSNCAGGLTPWGSVLSCEENTGGYYGILSFNENGSELIERNSYYGWEKYFNRSPEHYGWVAEIDPATGAAVKHLALGRFAHESATVVALDDHRVVVYMGDDGNNRCIYKFVGSKPNSLDEGILYVADFVNGKWIALDWNQSTAIQDAFKNQQAVWVRCREAAQIVGATPMNRPEDIEIDPLTGDVLISLTNNIPKKDFHGSILRIKESSADALQFSYDIFLEGSESTALSSPDNLAFDRAGNLWICCDRSGSMMLDSAYASLGNNQLFVVLRKDWDEPKPIIMATAPVNAEFTGPWFSPDGKSLFLSVQHPGEYSTAADSLLSHWPGGGDSYPKPSVVLIQGKLLEQITGKTALPD